MRGWSAVRSHSIRSSQTGSKLGILRALGLSFFFEGGSRSLEPGMAVVLPSSGFGFSRAAVRAVLALIAALVAVAAMAGPLSGCAWATTGHSFVGQFGGSGNGDGQFSEGGGRVGPAGVSVLASSNEIFTVDSGERPGAATPRVQRFSAAGDFQSAFAIDSQYGVIGALAVDSSGSGAVYVAVGRSDDVSIGRVVKYGASGALAYELDASSSQTSINPVISSPAIAVDPVDGTVYVTATSDVTGGRVIDRFDGSTGAFIGSFDGSGSPDGTPFCGSLTSVAVDGSHRVYVFDSCKGRVDRFSAAGVWEATLDPQLPLRGDGSSEALSAVAADPVSDEVYVSHTGPRGTQVTHFSAGGAGVLYTFDALDVGGVRGMAVSGVGTVYTSDATKPFVERFVRFDGPTVVTGGVSSPEPRSVVLEGTINPEGVESSYHFEYGTDLTYGKRSPALGDTNAGSGSVSVPASAPVEGLEPNKTYFYRLVGSNSSGSIAGSSGSFITLSAPPDVGSSIFASAITPRGARLHGKINTNNNYAHWYFEYGTTTAYGEITPGTGFLAGFLDPDGSYQAVSSDSAGLDPSTTYHFRLVAFDGMFGGTPVFGADQTFVTAPAAGGGASSVTAGRATLTGTINPHGVATTYHFNYGPTLSYGQSTAELALPDDAPIAYGGKPGEVTAFAPVEGLNPDTTYHVQVVATSTYEEENPVTHEMETKTVTRYGADGLFSTGAGPTARMLGPSPTATGTSTATLVGDLNNHGVNASYHFELVSRDGSFTLSTPPATAPASAQEQRVRAPVTGLPPGTTFEVVLVVESNDAVATSDPSLFETEALPRSFPGGNFAYPLASVEPAARPSVKFVSGVFTAKARKKASRTGMLPVKVSSTSAGIVTLTAKAKFGKKTVRVARISQRVKAGVKTQVNIVLNSRARKRLRSGKKLRVTISVRQLGARTRSTSILLPGVTS